MLWLFCWTLCCTTMYTQSGNLVAVWCLSSCVNPTYVEWTHNLNLMLCLVHFPPHKTRSLDMISSHQPLENRWTLESSGFPLPHAVFSMQWSWKTSPLHLTPLTEPSLLLPSGGVLWCLLKSTMLSKISVCCFWWARCRVFPKLLLQAPLTEPPLSLSSGEALCCLLKSAIPLKNKV